MTHTQITLDGVVYFRNHGSGGVDVVIGNIRRTTWTRKSDGAKSTGTYRWIDGHASLTVQGDLPDELFTELEQRYEAMKLAQ
jgi:hypothetical protein